MQAVAIIPAAGLGTRMGLPAESGAAARKQFLQIGDAPVIVHALRKFVAAETIGAIVVAVRDEDREAVNALLTAQRFSKPVLIAPGGGNRQESVQNALELVGADVEIVAVHDAVRPFISPALIDQAVRQAYEDGAVILGMPAVDTVKQVTQKVVQATLPRERIMMAQTPQVFRADLLRRAFEVARREGFHRHRRSQPGGALGRGRACDARELAQHQDHAPRGSYPWRSSCWRRTASILRGARRSRARFGHGATRVPLRCRLRPAPPGSRAAS
jgi:2-C-methyl-D-erythritol 4-phosphate cytidylyltransferase